MQQQGTLTLSNSMESMSAGGEAQAGASGVDGPRREYPIRQSGNDVLVEGVVVALIMSQR